MYMQPLEQIEKETGRRFTDIFDTFLCLSACSLAQLTKPCEDIYQKALEPYKPQEKLFQQAFADLVDEMQAKPYTDLLGGVYESIGSLKDKSSRGEYYTPDPICRMMAQMILPEPPKKLPFTVHEPTTGSGRMILAIADPLANTFEIGPTVMRVEAWDTSLHAVYMTLINTTLWGIPCNVVHSNTLNLEHWDVWPNVLTMMYPFPKPAPVKEEAKGEVAKTIEPTLKLGGGYAQGSLFGDLDKK